MSFDLKTALTVISTTVSVVVVAAGALMYWATGRESMAIDARRLALLEELIKEYKAEIAQIKVHANEVDVAIMRSAGDVGTQLARMAGDLNATRLDVSYMRDLLNEFRVSPYAAGAQSRAKPFETHDSLTIPVARYGGTASQIPTAPPSRRGSSVQDWSSQP